jgi:hypothetical protein
MSLVTDQVKHARPSPLVTLRRRSETSGRAAPNCGDDEREARCEIVAVPRDEPDTRAITARQNAKGVMLDFVDPSLGRKAGPSRVMADTAR